MGVAKLAEAATIMVTAKGRKLTPRLSDVDRAMGNIITAAALLVARALNKAVAAKTRASANQGMSCAKDTSHCAMADAAPEFCNAVAIPKDAAITTRTCQLTVRRAMRFVVQRVIIISPAANMVVSSMLSVSTITAINARK